MKPKSSWLEQNRIFLDLIEKDILALALFGEARGEGEEGMKAVACVIRNRVKAGGWFIDKKIAEASTATHGVILKKWQFSCFNIKDPNREMLEVMAKGIDFCFTTNRAMKIACSVAANSNLEDITGGATHYYEKHLPTPPKWASELAQTAEIGNHLFYV